MRRRFGKIINELAKKDKKMEFLMILGKIIKKDFLIWEFVNKVL